MTPLLLLPYSKLWVSFVSNVCACGILLCFGACLASGRLEQPIVVSFYPRDSPHRCCCRPRSGSQTWFLFLSVFLDPNLVLVLPCVVCGANPRSIRTTTCCVHAEQQIYARQPELGAERQRSQDPGDDAHGPEERVGGGKLIQSRRRHACSRACCCCCFVSRPTNTDSVYNVSLLFLVGYGALVMIGLTFHFGVVPTGKPWGSRSNDHHKHNPKRDLSTNNA